MPLVGQKSFKCNKNMEDKAKNHEFDHALKCFMAQPALILQGLDI